MGVMARKLMGQTAVVFRRSGARGLVAAMTDRVCFGYTEGFLRHPLSLDCWQWGGSVDL
jgi:phosphomannomutase